MLRKIVLLVAAPAAILAGGAAAPALASSTPASHTVNVTVGQEITLTGLQDVLFNNVPGTVAQGCAVTDSGCPTNGDKTETYSITSNDSLGYTLSETAGSGQFTSTQTSTMIPDSDWSISASNGGAPFVFSPSASSTTVFTTNNVSLPTGDQYTEAWTLAIPANTPAFTYNNTLTYLATGH